MGLRKSILCHPVRVAVVVDPLMILVWTNDIPQLIHVGMGLLHQQRIVKPRALQNCLRPALIEQAGIACHPDIFHDTVYDRCRDMYLLVLEVCPHRPSGEHVRHIIVAASVKAAFLGFPRIESAFVSVTGSLLLRSGQRVDPIAQQRPGNLRVAVQEEVQHKHFGVPEHSPLIGLPRQAPSGYGLAGCMEGSNAE